MVLVIVFATSLLLQLAIALSSSKRDCTNWTPAENYADGRITTGNRTFQVSQWLDCTEKAVNSRDKRYCDYHRYGMGLLVHPTLNITTLEPAKIFALLQDKNQLAKRHNFNTTIVMNFTSPITYFNVNQTGFYDFTPFLVCYIGTLSSCTGGDVVDNTVAEACGYKWLNMNQGHAEPGRQQYDGAISFVRSEIGKNGTSSALEPQPRYEDVAGQATVNQNTSNEPASPDSAAARTRWEGRIGILVLAAGWTWWCLN